MDLSFGRGRTSDRELGPISVLMPRQVRASGIAMVLALTLFVACVGQEGDAPEIGEIPAAASLEGRNFESRFFERNVVFMTAGQDSAIVVAWIFEARADSTGVHHGLGGWLARSAQWEPFFEDEWDTPPTRAPFRILPRNEVRLIMGPDDALERILFKADARELEVALDDPVADWGDGVGGAFRVHRGTLLMADLSVPGRVLDVNRSRRPDEDPSGDWIFLEGGPVVDAVLQASVGNASRADSMVGWARYRDQTLEWNTVSVTWTDTRAFEEARRDVPVAWALADSLSGMTGSLQAVASDLSTRAGTGARLPVEALFQVRGTLVIGSDTIPVRGMIRHRQR